VNDVATAAVSRRDARALTIDIYPPTAVSLRAAVILLHGGAWKFGQRADMADYARALASHGFTAIAAEYRLTGEAIWPAQILDVFDVLDWTARHAEALGLDANKIALLGLSAGGHLALLAAAGQTRGVFARERSESARVGAVVSAFAPPELRLAPPGAAPNPVSALLGPGATDAMARAASPTTYVSSLPATFLLGGMKDDLIPPSATLALFAALEAHGVPADLHLYHGHAHEFIRLPSMLSPVMAQVALFLKRAMVDPEGYGEESRALNPFARPGPPPALAAAPAPASAPAA
jgi:acetyl esterase/lipase